MLQRGKSIFEHFPYPLPTEVGSMVERPRGRQQSNEDARPSVQHPTHGIALLRQLGSKFVRLKFRSLGLQPNRRQLTHAKSDVSPAVSFVAGQFQRRIPKHIDPGGAEQEIRCRLGLWRELTDSPQQWPQEKRLRKYLQRPKQLPGKGFLASPGAFQCRGAVMKPVKNFHQIGALGRTSTPPMCVLGVCPISAHRSTATGQGGPKTQGRAHPIARGHAAPCPPCASGLGIDPSCAAPHHLVRHTSAP